MFYFSRLREMFDLKLFVDTDPDTRLARRVLRDISERGRDLENVLHQVQTATYYSHPDRTAVRLCTKTKTQFNSSLLSTRRW